MARGRSSTGKPVGKGIAKGPRANKLDAWTWAESTEPQAITQENIDTAYRVNKPPCVRGTCRVNCKFNPNCLNTLGERMWLGDIKDTYWHDCQDPEDERRGKDAFVGLKNLGATCYVNTFLQLWFHNPKLRSALYQWIPVDTDDTSTPMNNDCDVVQSHEQDTKEAVDTKTSDDNNSTKVSEIAASKTLPPLLPCSAIKSVDKSICAHLQLIFAQLQYSVRRYIDPMPLIHTLGLDTAQQQDAQEFSKLFMSLLESTLSRQFSPDVQEVIQKQFGGDYFYVTKCDRCGNKSKRLSRFYELDLNIQGHSSLSQCIKEFLKEEKLDGDNQYFCAQCQSKQDARRYIELDRLPPVLNLQLLRFIFDRKTGYKKKLHSFVQFPDVLNMNEIMNIKTQGDAGPVYELSAVLMHHGNSAYSGHYVAHIRDNKTQSWFKFNDEDTEKMNRKLKLTADDESSDTGDKAAKRPKCGKGFHTSRNAYMLVYTRQNSESSDETPVEAPEYLKEMVSNDNDVFEQWVEELNAMKANKVFDGKILQAEMRSIYEMLPAAGDDAEWVATDWLRRWLGDKDKVTPPIDNSSLLCTHGRLNPEKCQYAKKISTKAANALYTKYGGLPRLQRDSLCTECVRNKCRSIRFKFKITEDDKAIKAINKQQTPANRKELCYWVGKGSLYSWKKLARCEQDAQGTETTENPAQLQTKDESPEDVNRNRNGETTIRTTADKDSGKTEENGKKSTVNGEEVCNAGRKRQRNSACGREIERILKGEQKNDERTSGSSRDFNTTVNTRRKTDLSATSARDSSGKSDTSPAVTAGGLVNGDKEEEEEEKAGSQDERQGDSMVDEEEDEDEEMFKFNEDLLCDHGCLSPNEACRRLVPERIWRRLQYYFSSACEFLESSPVCKQCQTENEDERRRLEENKAQAAKERTLLSNLYHNRNRPSVDNQDSTTESLYIISNDFVDPWRQFLRCPWRCQRPDMISNASLLCPHGLLMFDPEFIGEDTAGEELTYTHKHEWEAISGLYQCDHLITVTRETETEGRERLVTNPVVCAECHTSLMLEKERECENYRYATIYIRKITKDHDPEAVQNDFDESQGGSDAEKIPDPDFPPSSSKRQRLSTDRSRRSSRHRKQRGEITLKVNSEQSLRDVKLELMKSFSVMPMDQHLSLRGVVLADDEALLGKLGIRPGCLLLLKTDEPSEATHAETFLPVSTAYEEGFKGTGLVGN